jgi:hypothetical protein
MRFPVDKEARSQWYPVSSKAGTKTSLNISVHSVSPVHDGVGENGIITNTFFNTLLGNDILFLLLLTYPMFTSSHSNAAVY